MSPEGKGLQQIVRGVGQKVDYFLQGRSQEENDQIIEIVKNPFNVSQTDIDIWRGEYIAEALSGPDGSSLRAMLVKLKIDLLPQKELKKRVLEDAMMKAEKWGLIPKARQPHP